MDEGSGIRVPDSTARRRLGYKAALSGGMGQRMQRRKVDRAQRMRARRIWWDRNGSFVRGFLVGAVITVLIAWIVQLAVLQ